MNFQAHRNLLSTIAQTPSSFLQAYRYASELLLRKEVIQPQVPLRLPCYDLVPITNLSLGRCLLAVSSRTSGKIGFHDLTGGVYKARERIQGVVADTPLLAIPASWSRVADIQSELGPVFGLRLSSRTRFPLYRPL